MKRMTDADDLLALGESDPPPEGNAIAVLDHIEAARNAEGDARAELRRRALDAANGNPALVRVVHRALG